MNDDGMNELPPAAPETQPVSPVPAGDWSVVSTAPPAKRNLHVATILGILALLAAGVFAFKNISGAKSGGDSPEGAVRALLDAASKEDLLGVLQQVAPGERDAIVDPLQRIRDELVRLGALKDNASLSDFPGVDIAFNDVKMATSSLADDVALVKLTGGTATFTVDPAQLPLGSFLRGLAGSALKKTTTTSQIADEDDFVVAVRRNGRWYASLYYSIAEGARVESGLPAPSFGAGVRPNGRASAEDAIEAFLRSAAALDVEGMIALTPPDEMGALHDYASLFVPRAKAGVGALAGGFRASITRLELGSEKLGENTRLVYIKQIGAQVTTPDGTFTALYDGKCLTSNGIPFVPPRLCGDDLRGAPGILGVPKGRLGFVAVQSGGDWYLSPTRTILESIVASLKSMQPGDLEKVRDLITGFGLQGFDSKTIEIPALPTG